MVAFPCLRCESPIDLLAFGGVFYPSSLFASACLGKIVDFCDGDLFVNSGLLGEL
jgi:hypothetical protein